MSEIALYRKYRPGAFKDVSGQDHIIKTLEASIANNKIAHAYLFSGSRGIGKTSIARIFAKEIGTTNNDIYEIDAASNRGIDDIREIRDAVHTLPLESKFKVYIVDEVHMLTKEAFNALLKTLEEPPAHVIFILATTEIEKLPDTVVSRCQVFDFKKPTIEILTKVVQKTAKKEGFVVDDATAELVAIMGDGAYRDTLGILGQVIGSSSDKEIDYDKVADMLGAPASKAVHDFIEAVLEKDSQKGLRAIAQVKKKGGNINLFARMVLSRMRSILLLRFKGVTEKELDSEYGDTDLTFIKKIAGDTNMILTSASMTNLITAIETIKHSPISELPLELFVIENATE